MYLKKKLNYLTFLLSNLLIILTIINIIIASIKADITSNITCCLTNNVEIITRKDHIITPNLQSLDILQHIIILKMYKKHNKQCMLGKQFNTGVSIKYIIFVIKPESPFKEIEFLNILVG